MVAGPAGVALPDRNEIHKSCKSLEVVVNILNDYCEAANAIVLLQKKLSKAMREAAASKCVGEVPANTLNTSAAMFETLSEVDTKFAKGADKECDGISAEVKKWFKKLAKEERAHDDRITSASAKIKQAGELYERKAKRNPRDAAEEHTRYMNLLSTLGPEVNQDKYNHAVLVSERHSTTMYSLAACLSRVADSEWLRTCEGVRRCAPTVGRLGEWRALCEGGWTGAVPADLPDPGAPAAQDEAQKSQKTEASDREAAQQLAVPSPGTPAPEYTSRQTSGVATPLGQSPSSAPRDLPGTTSKEQTITASSAETAAAQDAEFGRLSAPEAANNKSDTITSITSLSSFPTPPTHFPLPPVSRKNSDVQPGPSTSTDSPSGSRTSAGATPFPRFTESPQPDRASESSEGARGPNAARPLEDTVAPPTTPGAPPQRSATAQPGDSADIFSAKSPGSQNVPKDTTPSRAEVQEALDSLPSQTDVAFDAVEFGLRLVKGEGKQDPTSPTAERTTARPIERSDTGKSNGSVVAALRDRYVRTAGTSPPPRKEVPRLSGTVSNLAVKYEPTPTAQLSPRAGPPSPVEERRRISAESSRRAPDTPSDHAGPSAARYPAASVTPSEIDLRRQRIEELEELELREKEYELRMHEREIEQRAQQLELERARLANVRRGDGYTSDSARSAARLPPGPRPLPDAPAARYSLYSYSTTHLNPPTSTARPTSAHAPPPPADHSPSCGCEACSVSKYRAPPSPRDMRPPAAPIALRPEKPKGWIRRLSMPVINGAFSLDSKRGVSTAGIAGGPGVKSAYFPDEDGRLSLEGALGAQSRSTAHLARR